MSGNPEAIRAAARAAYLASQPGAVSERDAAAIRPLLRRREGASEDESAA